MSEEKKLPPEEQAKKINPEMLKMLAEALAARGAAGGAPGGLGVGGPSHQRKQPLTKRQKFMQGFMHYFSLFIKNGVEFTDRFTNYVVRETDEDRNEVMQAARGPILFGTYVIIIFFVFGGLWAGLAPLDSAATIVGSLVSSSNKKILNHPTGGILKAIYVKQGEKVHEGDPLVELDEVPFKAAYEAYKHQYYSLLAAEARIIAERDEEESVSFPEELTKNIDDPEIKKVMATQENLFKSRNEIIKGQLNTNQTKLTQCKKQAEGLRARKKASVQQYKLLSDRLEKAKMMQKKGYASNASVMELETKKSAAESEMFNADVDIAKNDQEISKIEVDEITVKSDHLSKILQELKETQAHLAEVSGKYTQSKDALDRCMIISPVDGVVNVLRYHTIGSQIPAQQVIAEVSPDKDVLVVEAKLPTKQIDSIRVGLKAKLKFSAFKSRTTPTFTGNVVSISPDVVMDEMQRGGGADPYYYAVRIEIDMDEFNKLTKNKNLELHPGMQTEVQIVVGTRTLLRYLLDPITDTMFKAFKER
ncbi:MAG: HlyD family type I secretion periplasmic adaptor subunit [Rickettsiaceae bacterium]|nr:HlyD family type I secretion periplasmic adaptor subunit [Rickettsiaceae bacterium]